MACQKSVNGEAPEWLVAVYFYDNEQLLNIFGFESKELL